MKTTPRLVSIVLVAVLGSAPIVSMAETSAAVTRLRADKVTLTGVPPNTETITFPRAQFTSPWPIRQNNGDGSLTVEVGGKLYSVAPWDVDTNAVSSVKQLACIDRQDSKLGATRGVGETCKR